MFFFMNSFIFLKKNYVMKLHDFEQHEFYLSIILLFVNSKVRK